MVGIDREAVRGDKDGEYNATACKYGHTYHAKCYNAEATNKGVPPERLGCLACAEGEVRASVVLLFACSSRQRSHVYALMLMPAVQM